MVANILRRLERANPVRIGLFVVIGVAVLGLALFQKQRIVAEMSPGREDVSAVFASDYRLRPYVTKVKVAGVPVGVVTGVEPSDDGALVEMEVDNGTRAKLGSDPRAAIRPVTLLGGNYYLDLRPGGDPGEFEGTIPLSATTVPVELDRVLEALQPDVRESGRGTISGTRETLNRETRRELTQLLASAPESLDEAAPVLEAVQGTQPKTDLRDVVSGMESTARALTRHEGELERTLDGLAVTGQVLERNGPALRETVADLPASLRTSRQGLNALNTSLDHLRSVSESARPTVRELDDALARLEPVLAHSRPLLEEAVPTLRDLRPFISDLVPTTSRATTVLDDLDGGPLAKLNGPVREAVLSPWRGGTGTPYEGNGNSTPLYQELGYMFAGGSASANMTDRNGPTLHFQPGAGVGSVSGLPISFEELFRRLLLGGGAR